jgi:hypothetical protein
VWCLLAMFCLPVPVLSMWHVCVLLLMHYLGAAECVVASGVFCNIYIFDNYGEDPIIDFTVIRSWPELGLRTELWRVLRNPKCKCS